MQIYFISLFKQLFPPKQTEGNAAELICAVFEVDTNVLFKAGCKGFYSPTLGEHERV